MRAYFFLFLLVSPIFMWSQTSETIAKSDLQGVVVDEENNPIPNASIAKLNSFMETESDEDGRFSIAATPGDVLKIVALWKETRQVPVENSSELRVVLKANSELLDEVLVINKRKEEVVNTPFGERRRINVGYQAKAMEEFIAPADIDMTVVVKRFPDVKWFEKDGVFSFVIRRNKHSGPALVVVDGIPVSQGFLRNIPPGQVETITLIKGLVGTIKYGTQAGGGVLVIETKTYADLKRRDKKEKPQLLVKGNDYKEQLSGVKSYMIDSTPQYLAELQTANSFEEAKKLYYTYAKQTGISTLSFFIDCSNYFQKWDTTFSYQVLSDVFQNAENNPKVLKTLAYQLEEVGYLNQAKFVYEKILELRPDHAQSYRDLALIYIATGEFEIAKALYLQMLFNDIPNVDFAQIRLAVANEFQHFLLNHRTKINFDDIPNDFLVATNRPETRLVLEWTDSMSEFEVQFVGPQNKYFVWSHSSYGDDEFVESEIKDGVSMKEFEIDKVPPGEWLVNIKNIKTNNTAGRTYLRYTLFKNYGLASEEKKTVLIPLEKLNEKLMLDTFLN